MPDENSTPVWTAQTSQNNQAITNQTWDDFVLDFWEWSNRDWSSMPEESENVKISLDETTKEETQNEMNLDLDGAELFNENKNWENVENNIVIQDLDTIFNESQNDGFDISLGDDTKIEDKSDSTNDDSKVESGNFTEIDENKENIQVPEEKFDEVVSNKEIEKESDDMKVIEDKEVENQESETQEIENQKIENENIIEEMHDPESTQENIEKSESEDVFLEEDRNDEEVKAEIANDTENGWETVETMTTDINDNFVEGIDLSDDINEKLENDSDVNQIDNEVSTTVDESNEELDKEQNFGDESINKDISEVSFDSTDNENVPEDGDKTEEEINQDTDNTETDIFSDSDLFQKDDSSENETEINNEDVNSQFEDVESQGGNEEEQKIEDETLDTPENSTVEDLENKSETLDNTEWDQTEIKIEDKEAEAPEQTPENLDFVMNFDSEEGNTQQEVKQPEIWDLMWDMNMDFPLDIPTSSEENAVTQADTVENIADSVMENINDTWSMNFEEDTNSEINDESEIKSSDDKNSIDNTVPEITIQNQNNEESLENVRENQKKADFTQSWENFISQEIPTNIIDNQPKPEIEDNLNQQQITEENKATGFDLQQAQAEQINNLNQVNNNVNEGNIQEKAKDDLNQQPIRRSDVATLSLDQILDSELNSNPQYADNSKAVPKNVPSSSWFFSKKTMWIIAVISLFAVAGYVAVLAFPPKNINREPQEVATSTWNQDHFVWYEPTTEPEEYPEIDEDKVNTWDDKINPVKNQVSFPDAGWEDLWIEPENSKNPENQEPEPYYCTGDECLEITEIEEPVDVLTVEEIKPIILDYKSSAEKYYSLWDDTQDKKLIKYALQIINLCDSYDSEIENEEWATQESIDNFKSQVKTLMTKIEKYVGGWEEVQTFTQSNFDEEYNFEWKDELKEYINSRDNY